MESKNNENKSTEQVDFIDNEKTNNNLENDQNSKNINDEKNKSAKKEEVKKDKAQGSKAKKETSKQIIAKLKKQLHLAETKIQNLEVKVLELEIENSKNIADFKAKAQDFASKAKNEIEKFKLEANQNTLKEVDYVKKYSNQKLLETIIEPILNIEMAVKAGKNNPNVQAYVMGFEMLLNQLYQHLESFGLVKINPQINAEFDPELHYALNTIVGEKEMVNRITEIKKPGFRLHDRVIKPATVVIGK